MTSHAAIMRTLRMPRSKGPMVRRLIALGILRVEVGLGGKFRHQALRLAYHHAERRGGATTAGILKSMRIKGTPGKLHSLQIQLAQMLQERGWTRKRRRIRGRPVWAYSPPSRRRLVSSTSVSIGS